jgi:hypothetical protein
MHLLLGLAAAVLPVVLLQVVVAKVAQLGLVYIPWTQLELTPLKLVSVVLAVFIMESLILVHREAHPH